MKYLVVLFVMLTALGIQAQNVIEKRLEILKNLKFTI